MAGPQLLCTGVVVSEHFPGQTLQSRCVGDLPLTGDGDGGGDGHCNGDCVCDEDGDGDDVMSMSISVSMIMGILHEHDHGDKPQNLFLYVGTLIYLVQSKTVSAGHVAAEHHSRTAERSRNRV